MRLAMSNLNSDLHKRHLTNDPSCACHYPQETSKHFLLYCPLYNQHRANTISNLPPNQISIHNLLHGNNSFSLQTNTEIFKIVHKFILLTKRFESQIHIKSCHSLGVILQTPQILQLLTVCFKIIMKIISRICRAFLLNNNCIKSRRPVLHTVYTAPDNTSSHTINM